MDEHVACCMLLPTIALCPVLFVSRDKCAATTKERTSFNHPPRIDTPSPTTTHTPATTSASPTKSTPRLPSPCPHNKTTRISTQSLPNASLHCSPHRSLTCCASVLTLIDPTVAAPPTGMDSGPFAMRKSGLLARKGLGAGGGRG